MEKSAAIDLKKEHQVTLETPRYKYSFIAKLFFAGMDLVAGRKNNLPKAKLLEILASIPYRVWEIRHYLKLTRKFRNMERVKEVKNVVDWGRDAQDNEYTHLLVIHEKMKEDGMKERWFLSPFVTFFAVLSYVIIAKTMAFFSQKRAFLFNAEFENHAEGVYAGMVADNPQWEEQKVDNDFVRQYADADTWADVFRRIMLDERDHMNHSFEFCGKPGFVQKYEGMPEGYEAPRLAVPIKPA
ncbi:MAG: alternative oxidase [Bacteroidota bacterium]